MFIKTRYAKILLVIISIFASLVFLVPDGLAIGGCCIDVGNVEDISECQSGNFAEGVSCGGGRIDENTKFAPDSSNNKPGFGSAGGFAKEAADASGVDVKSTLESKVASIVNYSLSLLGIIFLLLMVYGGYIWMMARGEEGEATKAKGIITMGVIGMAIVIAAYAITFFIVQRLIAGAA